MTIDEAKKELGDKLKNYKWFMGIGLGSVEMPGKNGKGWKVPVITVLVEQNAKLKSEIPNEFKTFNVVIERRSAINSRKV